MSLLLLFYAGGSEVAGAVAPSGGGADGPPVRRQKKKKRIYEPHELTPQKSVTEQVEEFLRERSKQRLPVSRKALRKAAAKVEESHELTAAEREALDYWARQEAIDAEEEEIIMLLMAA